MNKHKQNAKIATSLSETLEFGTDKTTKKYKKDTPGQEVEEGFKVGDKVKIKTSGLTRQTERGHKKYIGKSGKVVKDYGDGDLKVNFGGNDDRSVDSKDLVKEESEWEEMFGDSTYQDSYWGDPATIRGKI